jgi:tRNA A-37 threonylcarbamoyl transferase component Bud32
MKNTLFDLPPGRSLGSHYDVIELLGRGIEGEVYKIEERRTGIIRAAKLFYPRKDKRESPLLRYARKLNKLKSCPILIQYLHRDTARVRGQTIEFLVSDLADGEMLSDYLMRQKKKRLAPFEALHLLYALTIGIEQIHFLGHYHGDIHSDNIMVKRRGLSFDVRLLDFYDHGRPTKEKIQEDVFNLVDLLFEMIGGVDGYWKVGENIKKIIMGRKWSLVRKKFQNAGHLRLALENMEWNE